MPQNAAKTIILFHVKQERENRKMAKNDCIYYQKGKCTALKKLYCLQGFDACWRYEKNIVKGDENKMITLRELDNMQQDIVLLEIENKMLHEKVGFLQKEIEKLRAEAAKGAKK